MDTGVATFTSPLCLVGGSNGDLFVGEASSFRIRYINAHGIVHTLDTNLKSVVQLCLDVSWCRHIQSLAISPDGTHIYVAVGGIIFLGEFTHKLNQKSDRTLGSTPNSVKFSKWSGYNNIHRDFFRMDESGFGDIIRLAAPKNCHFTLSKDLYVLDFAFGELRRIRDGTVATLLPKGNALGHVTEGFSERARFPSPIAFCCTDTGILLTQNVDGTIIRTDHGNQKSVELLGKRFLLDNLAMTPSARSDFSLELFGVTWNLHRALIQLMAPGLLQEGVVMRLELAKETFTVDDFRRVLEACYFDASWNEVWLPVDSAAHPVIVQQTLQADISRFLSLFSLSSLIQCCRYQESVKLQLCDRFRHVAHQGIVFKEKANYDDRLSDFQHIGIDIIRQIADVEEDGLSLELITLFLPYAATIFRVHNLPASQVYSALLPRPLLLELLIDYVQTNRVEKQGVPLLDYHTNWHETWRSLLCSSTDLKQSCISVDGERNSVFAADIEIVGQATKWMCHKWILCKSPFFDVLFGSSFAESRVSVWHATPESLGNGFLEDDALGALLDYLYTDDISRINALSPSSRASLLLALPFFFLSDSDVHFGIIGGR